MVCILSFIYASEVWNIAKLTQKNKCPSITHQKNGSTQQPPFALILNGRQPRKTDTHMGIVNLKQCQMQEQEYDKITSQRKDKPKGTPSK